MIKVLNIDVNDLTKSCMVSLFADAKTDLSNSDIPMVPEGYDVEFGSSCLTADGDLAFMKSNGTWNWID